MHIRDLLGAELFAKNLPFIERALAGEPQLFDREIPTPSGEVRCAISVTEQGQVLVASGGGGQIGPYASGAGMVIWVVGAQKLVRTLEEGLRRLQEYALPLEDERMRAAIGRSTRLNQILIINGSLRPHRLKMVIVKEQLSF